MKNLFKSVVVAFTILISLSSQAQTKTTSLENSLLWEISGKGLSKTSYLYGTIHMICSEDYFLSEKVKKAFDVSDKLVLEINLADPKELADAQQMAMGKETLDKTLTPDQVSKLEAILKEKAGLSVQQVNNFSLASVMSLVYMKMYSCADIKMYEAEFIAKATAKNMEIGGLETVKSQMSSIDKAYSNDEMIALLNEVTIEQTASLVSFYKSENITQLYENITHKNLMSENTKKQVLDLRNANWVEKMPKIMKSQSTFFAIGLGHLSGDFGVIKLLRKAGYTVKPIMK